MTERKTTSLLGRITTRILSIAFTLIVVAGAGAAVMFGSQTLADRAAAAELPTSAPPIVVAVAPLTLQDGYTIPRTLVGQIESGASVDLSFELGGRLTTLLFEEGDYIAEGTLIAQLDTALLEAEADSLTASRAATEAQLIFAETRLTRSQQLLLDGFASQEQRDSAQATRDELVNRIAEIDAGLASVSIRLEKSNLYAPFSGRVGAQSVDGGETISAGQHVLSLIRTTAPQLRVGLPLNIDPTTLTEAEVRIGTTGYVASLSQIRPDIDPVTRTRTALFEIVATNDPIFGQTGALIIDMPVATDGVWVPVDALQEGAGDLWRILIAQDEGEATVVRYAAVELLHIEGTRAYVRGTFDDGALLINAGAHRVVPGQTVLTRLMEG